MTEKMRKSFVGNIFKETPNNSPTHNPAKTK